MDLRKRYLDDCFIIWKPEFGEHQHLFEILNNLCLAIKFTRKIGERTISFLDVVVGICSIDGNIETEIYRKPTDTMNYVHFNSAHPRHILKSIPYNPARRIRTIVSNEAKRKFRYE